ncbi:MAG: hypothetical protein H6551_11420 [Chitinophagales bacterium]|nr:hypothetical protein [Chitinophagaceae bacterium]MCB9065736.1 hypothetical protein [Chitinophagales bacterium]
MGQSYMPSSSYTGTIGGWTDKSSISSYYEMYLKDKEKNEKKVRSKMSYAILKDYHLEMKKLLLALESSIYENLHQESKDW